MPEKQKNGKRYKVSGKTFTWTTEDGETVEIPMRIKLKVIRELSGRDLDAEAMFLILEKLIPGETETLDEMDLNDFQAMFAAWQEEYQKLSGASLGE
jgi:hypothetical protein